MKYKLICKDEHYTAIATLIESYGLIQSNNYDILFVEHMCKYSSEESYVAFSFDKLNKLENILSKIISKSIDEKKLVVKDNESYRLIDYQDITLISAGNNCCHIFARNKYSINNSLQELEKKLLSKGFIRINKSEIINIMMIDKIDHWFSSRLIIKLVDGTEFTVTKSYYKSFKRHIGL